MVPPQRLTTQYGVLACHLVARVKLGLCVTSQPVDLVLAGL